MCGIAGVFGPFSEIDISKKIKSMCRAINHRGPDDKGYSTFPQQGIGMTRLSIIDLAGGHQPIWLDDNSVGIVFNGEIYNYKKLRQSLINRGASFKTHSDTEVILHLYHHEGIQGLKELEGMYSICLLDRVASTVYLVRDPIGMKPLYYGELDGGFYFASEIKSIISACDERAQINLQAVHDYLTFRYVPNPHTIWKNIHKLQPGHLIEYDLNRNAYSIMQYWDLQFNSKPLESSRNYAREFEELFLQSVNQQLLASDVPVGAFLSGGLDSSAICAAAVELGHTNFHTYSVAFQGDKKHSELNYARKVADYLGTNHHEVIVTVNDFKEFMEEQPWYTDEPLADITTVPLYFLSLSAKQDVKVVLSGEGADEFLAGYHYDKFFQVSEKRKKQLSNIPRFIFSMMAFFYSEGHKRQQLFKVLGQYGWEGFVRPYLLNSEPHFVEDDKKKLWNTCEFKDSRRINENILRACSSKHPLDLNMSVSARDWLVEDLLMKADKMTMAASLESRFPFLSRELMEWCCALPTEWKTGTQKSGYTTKRVLREFSAKRLPDEIVYREKKGFPTPVYEWLPVQLRDWADDVLFHQGLLEDWFDMKEIRELFDKAMENNIHYQEKIILLITLAFWKKKWM